MGLNLTCLVAAPHPPVTVLVHVVRAKSPAWIMANAHKLAMGRQIVSAVKMKSNVNLVVETISSPALTKVVFLLSPAAMDSRIVQTGATNKAVQEPDVRMVSLPAMMTPVLPLMMSVMARGTAPMDQMNEIAQSLIARQMKIVSQVKFATITDVQFVVARLFLSPFVALMETPTIASVWLAVHGWVLPSKGPANLRSCVRTKAPSMSPSAL